MIEINEKVILEELEKSKKELAVYDLTMKFIKNKGEYETIYNKIYHIVRNMRLKGIISIKKTKASRGSLYKNLLILNKVVKNDEFKR